jgi:hypothetical protein
MDMKKLTDLARTPAEMKAKNSPEMVGSSSREKYGYGTCITLDAEALKKLGIDELPEVGDEYHIMAVGKVTSVSKNASENNESTRLEIQLTHLDLEHEEEEEAEETPSEEKKEVYGSSNGIRFK